MLLEKCMMTEKTYGIAVVGAGNMGQRHMTNASQIPGFEIRAVADVDADQAEEQAKAVGAPMWTTEYQEVVSRPEIDVVFVCVPASFHAQVCVAAAESGKHVFCEKPLALDLEDGRRMLAAVKKAGVTLALNFQQRLRKVAHELRRMFAEGQLARPAYLVQQGFCEVRPKLAMNDRNRNGGPLVDVLCHWADLWRFLFQSDPVRVFARGTIFARGKPRVEPIRELAVDTAIVTVEFASGDIGCYQVSWGLPEGITGGGRTVLLTPDAWSEFDVFDSEVTIQRGEGRTETLKNLKSDPLLEQMKHLANALRSGTPPNTGGEDGLVALKVSLAALKSIETGEVVSL